MTLKIGINIFL